MVSNKRLESLRSARDFDCLRKNGSYFSPAHWLLVTYKKNGLSQNRCAWTISRHIGNAVVRNRIRRWGRERLRSWSNGTPELGLDFNLIFKRRDKEFYRNLDHAELDAVLDRVVGRFEKMA